MGLTEKAATTPSKAERRLSLRQLGGDGSIMRLFIITAAIFVIMGAAAPARFLTVQNLRSMSFQFPEVGLLAIAIMLSMLTGGIDLSVNAIANLSGILAALVMNRLCPMGSPAEQAVLGITAAILVSLATGLICGLANGFLIADVGITPILATLGSMTFFTGLAVGITKGAAVVNFPDQFLYVGNGYLLGLPLPLIIFALAVVVFGVILNRTALGFKLYMLGTNPAAARFSGVNNRGLLLRTYMMCGLLGALSGLVVIARVNTAKADFGSSYILQAILIAVLGGVNPSGGFGRISGLVLAILALQFLSSGFNMLRLSPFWKQFAWGACLLLVMALNVLVDRRRQRQAARQMATSPLDAT